ncbi:hypothetical protein BGZ49_010695, partial [Haplosporangium sp. Z 27]
SNPQIHQTTNSSIMNMTRNDRKTRIAVQARRGTDLHVAIPAKKNQTAVAIRTSLPLKVTVVDMTMSNL